MTLTTVLTLNALTATVSVVVAAQAGPATTTIVGEVIAAVECIPRVVKFSEPLGGVFGLGIRIVQVRDVLIPPQLNQTIASQADDPNIEQVYYLLRRYCTAFPPAVQAAIEPIRAKVEVAGDLSTLTADEITMVHTLNNLYNTDATDVFITTTVPSVW